MSTLTSSPPKKLTDRIKSTALHSSIDLTILPFHTQALESISALSSTTPTPLPDFSNATRIDTHTHPIPPWFRALEPLAAGRATPEWNLSSHLEFMASHGIRKSVLAVSTPHANAFMSERDEGLRKRKTVALARLLNEYVAQIHRLYPERFAWMAITPLPYVHEAIAEARYALEDLGASGMCVLTNHEGVYPGDESFDDLWGYLQGRAEMGGGRQVVFVHPTEPVVRVEGVGYVASRPSPLRSGLGEFYFETARAISSLTACKTLTKFSNLHWRISHGAGAFPDISERFLLGFSDESDEARRAYKSRFWYDSAGPVFPNQVKGLTEGMKVPVSQLVFGTDYPYGIGFWDVDVNIAGLADADFLSEEEKEMVYWRNAEGLWGDKILA
ncbi:hypothetical protein CC86DRAFT_460075 [Ophiobolus disseminans]|uniref:Amidohydrolase-related domain-containing protein n=1 Tax=Ophiobolus disseminans TaxID=1469910 RepID=A0A6A6ZIE1_9PLEO|nr:hypothetical protein CC86DRAFT_460075 [Ophiobolus disseminans]